MAAVMKAKREPFKRPRILKRDTDTHRTCRDCGVQKSIEEFYFRQAARKDGTRLRASECKQCDHAYGNMLRKADPAKRSRWFDQIKRGSFRRQLVSFGLSELDYARMLSEQNGCCAICKNPEEKILRSGLPQRLSLDHDHETDNVRGLLCDKCNRALGFFRDDVNLLVSAVAYLTKNGQGLPEESSEPVTSEYQRRI